MALKINKKIDGVVKFKSEGVSINIKNDIIEREFYCKILNVSGSKNFCNIDVNYSCDDVNINKTFSFTPDMEGSNYIAQGYYYLKTLDEFKNAIDC